MTERPLYHRTNLNLYTTDVEYMQRVYGRGWTEHARDIIHQELKDIKQRVKAVQPTYPRDISDNDGDCL